MTPLFWRMVAVFIGSFLLGSVPFGLIVGQLWGRVDVRRQGSGNIGTTNVLRTVGPLPAAVVLLLDAAKGWLPVVLAQRWGFSDSAAAVAALAAVAGHSWSVFLRFKGGRGVATALGVVIALSPRAALVLVGIFAVVVAVSGYVSLGSIVASFLLPFALFAFGAPGSSVALGAALGLVSVVRHRPNIERLLAGTENRFGRPNPHQRRRSKTRK